MPKFAILLMAAVLTSFVTVEAAKFEESRLYIEYNSTDNDLGFHVSLDGEDWKTLKIFNPNGTVIFDLQGAGPYKQLGMTELFF